MNRDAVRSARFVFRQGLNLIGMEERAALVNGEIEIESAKGNGTIIYVRVPARYEQAEI